MDSKMQTGKPGDSMVEILGRAFDPGQVKMPRATAELIANASLPQADLDRVDDLLERKRDVGLSTKEEALLQEYLRADCLLTVLKSKARQALRDSVAA